MMLLRRMRGMETPRGYVLRMVLAQEVGVVLPRIHKLSYFADLELVNACRGCDGV